VTFTRVKRSVIDTVAACDEARQIDLTIAVRAARIAEKKPLPEERERIRLEEEAEFLGFGVPLGKRPPPLTPLRAHIVANSTSER
jgi:hypothetical protein